MCVCVFGGWQRIRSSFRVTTDLKRASFDSSAVFLPCCAGWVVRFSLPFSSVRRSERQRATCPLPARAPLGSLSPADAWREANQPLPSSASQAPPPPKRRGRPPLPFSSLRRLECLLGKHRIVEFLATPTPPRAGPMGRPERFQGYSLCSAPLDCWQQNNKSVERCNSNGAPPPPLPSPGLFQARGSARFLRTPGAVSLSPGAEEGAAAGCLSGGRRRRRRRRGDWKPPVSHFLSLSVCMCE